jgi:hypothetical protein
LRAHALSHGVGTPSDRERRADPRQTPERQSTAVIIL